MAYIGNDLQVAFPSYRIIDDISSGFNGSQTTFALTVGGATPVPFPINPQQCLISVNGVIQKPDPTGASGFNLVGSNIVFASAPTGGWSFFGVILAGADYVNVGANFPSGSAGAPSITFDSDTDTGIYNSGANQVSISTAGVERFRVDSAGQLEAVSLGSAASPTFSFTTDTNTGIYSPGADQVAISTNGSGRLFIDSSGRVGIGTTSASFPLQVHGSGSAGTQTAAMFRASGSSATAGAQIILSPDAILNYPTWQGAAIANIYGGSTWENSLAFKVNKGGGPTDLQEVGRWDPSGRLLVGTSSSTNAPSGCKLVVSTQSASPRLEGTNGYGLDFVYTGVPSTGFDLGFVGFKGYTTGTTEAVGAWILGEADGNWAAGSAPSRLVFSTTADGASSPTERMRIRNTGQVWINQTGNIFGAGDSVLFQVTGNGADYAAAVANDNASPYGLYLLHNTDINNNTNTFLICYGSTTQRAAIRTNGGFANYQANNVNLSDINTKKDITPAAGTWDCIKEWEIVNYRYKDQPDDADLNLGVIAQQVAESCPEVITVFEEAKEAKPAVLDEDGNEVEPAQEAKPEKLGIKEQQMYWMAIKALQEAQVRIETLEAKVAALEGA